MTASQQPRERATTCRVCGHITLNPSGLCGQHEVPEVARAALETQGYGPQMADRIVGRLIPAQRTAS